MKLQILPSSFAHTTAMSATGELVIHLIAGEPIAARGLLGAGFIEPASRAVVGFGEAENAKLTVEQTCGEFPS